MMRKTFLTTLSYILALCVQGQEKWTLRQCVEYAWANNISVKQADVQARIGAVNSEQARWERYPNANFSSNVGLQFGRSIDPTTNQFTTTQLLGQGFNFNASITIFNWNRIRNNVISSRYEADAAVQDLEKVKNDIGLSVASYYLQALLSREQVGIARVQMTQTRLQLESTRKKVEAGALPELNALTLESQYATDSAAYIGAIANADQTLLQLKALLNVDAAQAFDIATPPVDMIPVDPIAALQPEAVFSLAMTNQPAQKANELRLKSWQSALKVARAGMYPTIALGGGIGTNFANSNKKITGYNFVGYESANSFGPVADAGGGTYYPILSPKIEYTQSKKTFGEMWTGWGSQINQNFRQSLGLTISVPINNGGAARFNYQRTKLNYKNAEIAKEQADQKLKNDIYTAYYNAVAALDKYNATQLVVESAAKTFDFSQKRYDLGLLSTFDLIISQNNLSKARLDMALSHFDYVFKMKVLEFYKGMGIRLQ